ncbi:MAG: hypothetical protein HYZ25_04440 [Chloroflexi bacterium]|nr:hypothetical protein [Chloroflexota bacterium]
MFDNLRDDSESKPFFQDESGESPSSLRASLPEPRRASSSSSGGRILGMTAIQRFVLSVMLLVMVCVLGMMFLLITGKIGIFF